MTSIGSLRKWNVAAAILHWAQAIYMWSLIEGSDFAVTVARFGPLDVQNGQPTGLKPVLETDISIGWIPSEISVGMLVVAFSVRLRNRPYVDIDSVVEPIPELHQRGQESISVV